MLPGFGSKHEYAGPHKLLILTGIECLGKWCMCNRLSPRNRMNSYTKSGVHVVPLKAYTSTTQRSHSFNISTSVLCVQWRRFTCARLFNQIVYDNMHERRLLHFYLQHARYYTSISPFIFIVYMLTIFVTVYHNA